MCGLMANDKGVLVKIFSYHVNHWQVHDNEIFFVSLEGVGVGGVASGNLKRGLYLCQSGYLFCDLSKLVHPFAL